MEKPNILLKTFLLGLIAAFLLGGCASFDNLKGYFFGEEEELSAPELMAEGMEKMESGNYTDAVDAFQNLKDRYPYSGYAVVAELKMAEALFRTEQYDEAIEAYDEFERLHPKNENIPYVIYQKGMSHFLQMSTIDREQSNTYKAKEEFERLIKRFPRDPYANRARKNIRKCLIYLAEYELLVGHFYYKMGRYQAALDRYSYIIKNYPDMGQYHEALEYISKCKAELAGKKE